jgi:hypothetical protein
MAPLPVTLKSFTAEKDGSDAVLTWATASEQNNQGFGVEVSTDGEHYRSLGFVASKGANAQKEQRYSFRDSESGKFGTRYYRLRQTDLDGTVTYSAAKAVTFDKVVGTAVSAHPNPFNHAIQVVIESDVRQRARMIITDVLGREVYDQEVSVEVGANRKEITLSERDSTGIYLLTTYVGDRRFQTKLVKE